MSTPSPSTPVALIDLLDRLLAGGVVIAGDLTLRIADVDLVRVDLRALISSVNENVPSPFAGLAPEEPAAADPLRVTGPSRPAATVRVEEAVRP
ncbi:gas vesicle protein [Streptomyces sp. NPDC047117]|uniref:gas vesicle protein n=1 Tax=Streptomyces sp. NPDC047117 TaxID=3155379 RepID=UPI0034083E8D